MKSIQLLTIFIYSRVLLEYASKLGAIPNSIIFGFTAVAGFLLMLVNMRQFRVASIGEAIGGLALLAFVLFDLARALSAGDPAFILASIYYSVLLLLIFTLASTSMYRVDGGNLRAMLYLFSFGSLFTALLDFPLGLARVFDATGIARPSGLWVNPNSMAFINFITIASALAMRAHGLLHRNMMLLVCAAAFAVMLLAFSLSGLSALALLAGGMLLFGERVSRVRMALVVVLLLVAALVLMPGFIANLQARLLSFGNESNSLTYRVNMALIALRLLQDPVFMATGGGFWFEKDVLGEDLHNDYMRLVVAGGLFLTLSFLFWVLALALRLTKTAFADRRMLSIWLALGISLGWGLADSVFRTNPGSLLLFLMCSPYLFIQYRRNTP